MSRKTFSIWLLISLIVGVGLGGYLAFEWKDREMERRVAEAIKTEQDRQGPLRDEVDSLREEVERKRLLLELSAIAVEVDHNNFGLAQERLIRLGEELTSLATRMGSSRAAAIQAVLVRQQEIVQRLEALDAQAATDLHQLFGDLQRALEAS